MKDNKNNATEKVENIVENKAVSEPSRAEVVKAEIKANGKKTQKSQSKRKNTNKANNSESKKVEKEKAKAKARVEKAKLKKEKHDRRIALRKERSDAFDKAMKDYELEKLKRKEERLKRRDMLKNETKKQRENRIAKERQAKAEAKQAKIAAIRQAKADKRRIKQENYRLKKQLKQEKRQLRFKNKQDKRNRRGFGGWLAAVISLGASTLVLATVLFFGFTMGTFGVGGVVAESSIQKTFYDFVSYVDGMEVSLSKLSVSNSEKEQQKLLSELTVQANLAASDISALPIMDESKYYTTKYINQVGDYAKYLNEKLIDGGSLSNKDYENLESLSSINTSLKGELTSLAASITEDYKFVSMLSGGDSNFISDKFTEMESAAALYPKLIYDGPFSDALETSTVKGLSGEEISKLQAEDIFKSAFTSYGLDSVMVIGETVSKINCYNVEAMTTNGERLYAQISKVGGKIISFDAFKECHSENFSEENCLEIANGFIKTLGLNDMSAVWFTASGNTVYANYVYEANNAIYYPDMIKITVCQERGVVNGFDATEYYLNHTTRKAEKATITKGKAMDSISTKLDVTSCRLAVIPVGNGNEKLSYEVAGSYNDSTYYIYVDAKSGDELQIFKVVNTTEGKLLI